MIPFQSGQHPLLEQWARKSVWGQSGGEPMGRRGAQSTSEGGLLLAATLVPTHTPRQATRGSPGMRQQSENLMSHDPGKWGGAIPAAAPTVNPRPSQNATCPYEALSKLLAARVPLDEPGACAVRRPACWACRVIWGKQ